MLLLVGGGVAGAILFRANPPPVTRGAIAGEHWHAAYQIYICGKRMTNYPTVEGEIHSHGDGFMHIHPASPTFTGPNATLASFLRLYQTDIGVTPKGKRFIAFPDQTRYEDGDKCGKKERTLVLENKGKKVSGNPAEFIPHEGDVVVIRFGPKGKGKLENPYAKTMGIPDPGFGSGSQQQD